MIKKNKLMTIGELSKLTNAGIKSIRYYERINILKPAYISPETNYRYYTMDQAHLVGIIMACIEFGIPLKELTNFIDKDNMIDFSNLLKHGKEIAEQKIKKMNQGLNLIAEIERQIDLSAQHQLGEIYTREMREMHCYIQNQGTSLDEVNSLEVAQHVAQTYVKVASQFQEEDNEVATEYGLMCKHTPEGKMYYVFIELPRRIEMEGLITIPACTYYCRQDKDSQIEKAAEIFKEQLAGCESFLAIEIEMFTARHKVSEPVNELRVLVI